MDHEIQIQSNVTALLEASPFWGPLDDAAVFEEVDFKNLVA
jgi:hypothetical protein